MLIKKLYTIQLKLPNQNDNTNNQLKPHKL